jgi:hypothetical protein
MPSIGVGAGVGVAVGAVDGLGDAVGLGFGVGVAPAVVAGVGVGVRFGLPQAAATNATPTTIPRSRDALFRAIFGYLNGGAPLRLQSGYSGRYNGP